MLARWAPIPLRLIVGYGFMEHGFAKLSKGTENFAAILHAIGVPAPHFMAWLTILTSGSIGGLAVLLGAFVPLVSLPMAALLFVAIFTVHLPYGFSSIKLMSVTAGRAQFGPPGYRCNLLYLAGLAALVFGGSGPMAIDDYLRKKLYRLDHNAWDTPLEICSTGRLSDQAGREADKIPSVMQPFVIDWTAAC